MRNKKAALLPTEHELFDRPALRPLPEHPYEFVALTHAKVGIDYHVEFDHNFYSVPSPGV